MRGQWACRDGWGQALRRLWAPAGDPDPPGGAPRSFEPLCVPGLCWGRGWLCAQSWPPTAGGAGRQRLEFNRLRLGSAHTAGSRAGTADGPKSGAVWSVGKAADAQAGREWPDPGRPPPQGRWCGGGKRLLRGEGGRPRGRAAHPDAPAVPLQAAPSLVCGKLNPVNSSGEEPGLRRTGRGHRPLEGTERATFRCWGWGSGSSRSYSKRAAGAHRRTLFPYWPGHQKASTHQGGWVASRGAV